MSDVALIELLVRTGALRFGDFTTKSGRRSPYFINLGAISRGPDLDTLGQAYARTIAAEFPEADNLFGPAYKGIPLACATALCLARDQGRDLSVTFNRKEAKDHGEGGNLVGHTYRGGERVVIVEDVTTAGTAVREVMPLLQAARVQVCGLVVAVDRQERGPGGGSALAELAAEFGLRPVALLNVDTLAAHLASHPVDGRLALDAATAARLAAYRREYGA